MKGVVLFADDDVHQKGGAEHMLYELFRNEFVVLSVDNLTHLEHALKTVSTFDAIILDCEFIEKNIDDDPDLQAIGPKKNNPLSILKSLKLFSKIFVYSNAEIDDTDKAKLQALFPGRVEFKKKNIRADQKEELHGEFVLIKDALNNFSSGNQNLDFSIKWGRAINQALQGIFSELSAAQSTWLKTLYDTSVNDNGNAILEVIELMNNLLAEELIQDLDFREAIEKQASSSPTPTPANNDQGAAKLFQRIYYTAISHPEVPIMTGDIFQMSDDEYAILITPECDVYTRNKEGGGSSLKSRLEILVFSKKGIMNEFKSSPNKGEAANYLKKFNQDEQAKHILPSFPYDKEDKLLPAVIVFSNALRSIPSRALVKKSRLFKLNAPYIQQLRQRFSTAHSRVGVPAINSLVRSFNLLQTQDYHNLINPPIQPPTKAQPKPTQKSQKPTPKSENGLVAEKDDNPLGKSNIKQVEIAKSASEPTVMPSILTGDTSTDIKLGE